MSASGSAWALGDIGVGLMAWLNIIAILILQGPAFKLLRDFERQRKQGLDPVFDPRRSTSGTLTSWWRRERKSRKADHRCQAQLSRHN
ncbi:alanine:cation symporter family protein [Brevibacterium aurantiacum]|uniref:alanine:cation symporter family protein n=1 Tax=Brevibacterium aurantiacum TaxID=273384 RepID=UPI001F4997AA